MGKIKIIGNLFTLTFAGSEVYTTFAAANTGVAQLVEHRSPKPGVGSSSLSSRAEVNRKQSMTICGFSFYYHFLSSALQYSFLWINVKT